MAKRELIRDKESGVRSITQIENLPVKALTDDEICKLFFSRFKAKALVMVYLDDKGEKYSYNRLYGKAEHFDFIERVQDCWIHQFGLPENWAEL